MIVEREKGKPDKRGRKQRAGQKDRGVGGRGVEDGGGLLPSSHARLRCYDNKICGQA